MSVSLLINGQHHEGWKQVQVIRSIETLSGAFFLTVSNPWRDQAKRAIKPGDSCQVLLDEQVVISGYVDRTEMGYNATEHRFIATGRDKTGDLVACDVGGTSEGETSWRGIKLEGLIKDLISPFGIEVQKEVDTGDPLERFIIGPGMTYLDAIQEACQRRQCLVMSDTKGGLLLTRAGEKLAPTGLVEGKNILAASGNLDDSGRFSHYTFLGQGNSNRYLGQSHLSSTATAQDSDIRYRPFVSLAEGDMGSVELDARARWEMSVRRGRARAYSVTVQGWCDGAGNLWPINQRVRLISPSLGVDSELLITEASYRLDKDGQVTELSLMPVDAYAVLPNKVAEDKPIYLTS